MNEETIRVLKLVRIAWGGTCMSFVVACYRENLFQYWRGPLITTYITGGFPI